MLRRLTRYPLRMALNPFVSDIGSLLRADNLAAAIGERTALCAHMKSTLWTRCGSLSCKG